MHILIAPNAFKNSLNASEASEAIRQGLKQSKLGCTCECFPIGDGGDGTARLIVEKCKGSWIESEVHDPLGRMIKASFGLIDKGKTAVIEMADASGIRLLLPDELDPLRSSSFGTGEMIRLALDRGVNKILIGLGGSATVDGGAGILKAIGLRFLDRYGKELSGLPESLSALDYIDISGIDQRILKCEITVLCDVDNSLLGEKGAAAIFGPQKGSKVSDIPKLEQALQYLSEAAFRQTGRPMNGIKYGGAAGGTAAALYSFFNATLVNGAEYFLQLTGFAESLKHSDLVITGEGSLDEQTLQGKGPFAVAKIAKQQNIPVIGVAGRVPLNENLNLNKYFDVLMAIGHQPSDLDSAIKVTAPNLIRTSTAIGNMLSMSKNK